MTFPYIELNVVVKDSKTNEAKTFPICIHKDHIWSFHNNIENPEDKGVIIQYKGQPTQVTESWDELVDLLKQVS